MSEFEWIDNTPISDEEHAKLSPAEVVKREENLALILGAYAGMYVEIVNSSVVKAATTLGELMKRNPSGSVIFVDFPEEGESFFRISA